MTNRKRVGPKLKNFGCLGVIKGGGGRSWVTAGQTCPKAFKQQDSGGSSWGGNDQNGRLGNGKKGMGNAYTKKSCDGSIVGRERKAEPATTKT